MKKKKIFSKAEQLRKDGYSLNEISQKLDIAKSTASQWLKKVKVSVDGKNRLRELSIIGMEKSKKTNSLKKMLVLKKIYDNCSVLVGDKYSKDDFKIFLSLLYWGEGAKTGRRVVLMNSDPKMVEVFLNLFRKSFDLDENKFRAVLHLHGYHNKKELIDFWSKLTRIEKNNFSIYQKENTGKSKNSNYKGCISVRYGDSKIFDEISLIINRLINRFAGLG